MINLKDYQSTHGDLICRRSGLEYIQWFVGESKITLDGAFSSNDLRILAHYMDTTKPKEEPHE